MTEIIHRTTPFDVEAFLAEGNEVRVATNGPTVRPMWFQYEDGHFWLMSGAHSKLYERIQTDPQISLVVDVFEADSGRVLQVMATGEVEETPYDVARAERMISRYLGNDPSTWHDNYRGYILDGGPPGMVWLKLNAEKILSFDFSFEPPSAG